VPGNRWVAAAAAPCASPACLPVLRTRPALPFPMLLPEPAPRVGGPGCPLPLPRAPAPSPSPAPGLLQWEDGRAANRLQSEWAAEIYWGVRGDASVSRDLLASRRRMPNRGGGGGQAGDRGWDTGHAGPRFGKVLRELVT
jgi:hypothetical protein